MKLRAVMFTDRVGSVAATASGGDRIRDLINRLLTEFTKQSGLDSRFIKDLGDGHMMTFESAFDAIRAGMHLKHAIQRHNATNPPKAHIELRIGIDAGDVDVGADNDVHGNAVDMAKRIEGSAIPGEVVLSERAWNLVRKGYAIGELIGPVHVKGIAEPINVYKVISCESENPPLRQHLERDLSRKFLQILIPRFEFERRKDRQHLILSIDPELEVIARTEEKDSFAKEQEQRGDAREDLERDLHQAREGGLRPIQCQRWPLRYANGGVLPILNVGGDDFFCLFYRDKFPIGWNIANGASDTLEELLYPERVIEREFGEELFIVTPGPRDEPLIRAYRPKIPDLTIGFQKDAIKMWAARCRGHGYHSSNFAHFSAEEIEWIYGPDKITVQLGDEIAHTDKVFVSITPFDNAIEVDRIARIRLKHGFSDFHCLDGELSANKKTNVARMVGLFDVGDVERRFAKKGQKRFKPTVCFYDGNVIDDIDSCLQNRRKELGTEAIGPQNDDRVGRWDLCPITHEVIRRYFQTYPTQSKV
jgi:class 3 adenylate cyclase